MCELRFRGGHFVVTPLSSARFYKYSTGALRNRVYFLNVETLAFISCRNLIKARSIFQALPLPVHFARAIPWDILYLKSSRCFIQFPLLISSERSRPDPIPSAILFHLSSFRASFLGFIPVQYVARASARAVRFRYYIMKLHRVLTSLENIESWFTADWLVGPEIRCQFAILLARDETHRFSEQ